LLRLCCWWLGLFSSRLNQAVIYLLETYSRNYVWLSLARRCCVVHLLHWYVDSLVSCLLLSLRMCESEVAFASCDVSREWIGHSLTKSVVLESLLIIGCTILNALPPQPRPPPLLLLPFLLSCLLWWMACSSTDQQSHSSLLLIRCLFVLSTDTDRSTR
jgi:hypothetical protein